MSAWNPFRRDPGPDDVTQLYAAITAQARKPSFYATGGVPDSIDGRFEMIALHAYLILHRLRGAGEPAERLSQALVDVLFDDMDASLREMGAGDLGVGKRVKRMATGFYGRVGAYDAGQAAGDLSGALRRNLFGTVEPTAAQVTAMTEYVGRTQAALANQQTSEVLAGRPAFGAPEASGH